MLTKVLYCTVAVRLRYCCGAVAVLLRCGCGTVAVRFGSVKLLSFGRSSSKVRSKLEQYMYFDEGAADMDYRTCISCGLD